MWAYDFVFDTCADGRSLKCLTIVDEFTRECLAIDVAGSIRSGRVIDVLGQLVSLHGAPRYLRSDNGLPQKSRRQSFSDLTMGSVDSAARRQAGSTFAESHADHSHTGSRPRPACPHEASQSVVLQVEGPSIIYEVACASTARGEGILPLGLVASGKRR